MVRSHTYKGVVGSAVYCAIFPFSVNDNIIKFRVTSVWRSVYMINRVVSGNAYSVISGYSRVYNFSAHFHFCLYSDGRNMENSLIILS